MKKILLVIDVQNGFTRTEQTKKTADDIVNLLKKDVFDSAIATQFLNTDNSPYQRFMNWQGLTSSQDQKLYNGIKDNVRNVIQKNIYTAVGEELLSLLKKANDGVMPKAVFICGIDTEICVLKTAVDLFELGVRPIVLKRYCQSNGGQYSHNAGIASLRRFIGSESIIGKKYSTKFTILLSKYLQ